MLLYDIRHNGRMDTVHARDLQNAVVRHHKNNPYISMEAAFEYIMSISSTYRALPAACIEKARKYLALPETVDKNKQMSDKDTYTELNKALQDLSDNNLPLFLMPFRQVITVKERTPTQWNSDASPIDDLKEMFKDPINPGTTVVHAERCLVDGEKMVKILRFDNVEYAHNLPKEYTDKSPHFYVRPGSLKDGVWLSLLINNDTFSFDIMPGDKMYVADFNRRISAMKEAAARLSKINKAAKLEREHSGKFTMRV